MPIVSSAINEMLLQSHEGAIRVCPAVPTDWDVRFDLAAAGGFRVSAERVKGEIVFVAVESRLGGTCRMVCPWPLGQGACFDVNTGGEPRKAVFSQAKAGPDHVLRWETEAGHRYLLVRSESMLKTWKVVPVTPAARPAPRHLGQATLGRERLY